MYTAAYGRPSATKKTKPEILVLIYKSWREKGPELTRIHAFGQQINTWFKTLLTYLTKTCSALALMQTKYSEL